MREYLEILEEDLVARAEKLDKKGQLRNAEMEKRIKTLFNPETRILDVDIQEKYRVLFEVIGENFIMIFDFIRIISL